jgi:hypothetical protein
MCGMNRIDCLLQYQLNVNSAAQCYEEDMQWSWGKKLCFQIYWRLTFKLPAFAYVNTHKKTPLEVCFIYLGILFIYCIFKMCSIVTFILHTLLFMLKFYVFVKIIFFS